MNKKAILIFLWVLLVPGVSYAAAYVAGTYGFGGKTDSVSWGAELGGVFLSDWHPTGGAFSAGVGFSVSETGDSLPNTAVLTPGVTPTLINKYNDGNENEGYVNFGVEIVPSLFGTLGIGYASQKTRSIGEYNGLYYETESKTDNNVTGMLGVRYTVEYFTVGMGFHTRRGVMLNLGFAF